MDKKHLLSLLQQIFFCLFDARNRTGKIILPVLSENHSFIIFRNEEFYDQNISCTGETV